jgi:hypothetical protein
MSLHCRDTLGPRGKARATPNIFILIPAGAKQHVQYVYSIPQNQNTYTVQHKDA